HVATLEVDHDGSESPLAIALSGTGEVEVVDPVGNLSADPSSLAFGTVVVGADNALEITVSNDGAAAVSITSVSLAGADADDFAHDLDAGTVPAGESVTFEVTFTPSAAGAHSASLVIVHDGESSPLSVALGGTGEVEVDPVPVGTLSTSPGSLDF